MNLSPDFKNISNEKLLSETLRLVGEERGATLVVLHALREVEGRSLHSQLGYSSLYAYCTEHLKYSCDAAMRRISAMRLLSAVPEVEEKVAHGELKLSQLAQVQTMIRAEMKQGHHLKKLEKLKIIEKVAGQSTRETEKILLSESPAFQAARKSEERVRVISEEITELKIHADSELMNLLEEARALCACPQEMNPTVSRLFKEGLRALIAAKEKQKFGVQSKPSKPDHVVSGIAQKVREVPQPETRSIPTSLKRIVFDRAKNQCEYISPMTGECCQSKHALELHHLQNFSQGGAHSLANLKVFCHSHNHAQAKADFPWLKAR